MKRGMAKLGLVCAALLALPAASSFAADDLAGSIEGVYKRRFMNTINAGADRPAERYLAEDVVEIVRQDADHLYLRAYLEFANGHTCSVWGIAGREGEDFVYRQQSMPAGGEAPCSLKVSVQPGKIVLDDRDAAGLATCRAKCGARGTLSGYTIERKARRPIRYMNRLQESRQYREAVSEFQGMQPPRS
ncbi:MAG TPA: hypothetical protein DDX04_00495 [Massilia sp.]|nr:hypothetical protein [Massilia sp.]